jgi:hypothetical protein
MADQQGPPAEAAQILGQSQAARRQARLARRAAWCPLLTFGVIIMAATPFYLASPPRTPVGSWRPGWLGYLITPAGGASEGLGLYWLIAPPAAYGLVAAFYIWITRRRGVRARILPYCLAGIAFVALMFLTSPIGPPLRVVSMPGDLAIRGLDPIIGISLGIVVLAWLERSRGLAAFSALFLATTLLVNLYDVSNQAHLIGWNPTARWEEIPNLWLAGIVLLLGGAAFALAERFGRLPARLSAGRS